MVSIQYKKVYEKNIPEKGRAVFSSQQIKKGEIVIIGKPIEMLNYRTWLSLQFDENNHIHMDLPFSIVNHSCNPNCGIIHNKYGGYTLIALKEIPKDKEIVFDYAMTEWDCVAKFKCSCGYINCRKTKIAARHLEKVQLEKYYPYISEYLLNKLFK